MPHTLHTPGLESDRVAPIFYARRERSQCDRATVLLAEDVADLRHAMEVVLISMSFSVVACADALLAAAVFYKDDRIDLPLTDCQMPGKDRHGVRPGAYELNLTLPVIILTASMLTDEVTAEIENRNWLHLRKPCSIDSLQAGLRRMLHPTSAAASPRSSISGEAFTGFEEEVSSAVATGSISRSH